MRPIPISPFMMRHPNSLHALRLSPWSRRSLIQLAGAEAGIRPYWEGYTHRVGSNGFSKISIRTMGTTGLYPIPGQMFS